jgi:hypothetical protein
VPGADADQRDGRDDRENEESGPPAHR